MLSVSYTHLKVLYKYKGSMPENTKLIIPNEIVSITDEAFYEMCIRDSIRCAELIGKKELSYKVVILLSVQEETYGTGAKTGAYRINADEAIRCV